MRLLVHLSSLLAAASVTSATVTRTSAGDAPAFELLILHNNDMHARFEQTSQLSGACTTADREAGKCYGGFPRVAHVVKEARRAAASGEGPPVLYLNAGDTYTGTAWFTIYKWKIAAEFLNALQPDAVSLGNHEFDNGVIGLTPFIENLTCPILAANLDFTNEPALANETNLKKSVTFNVNGTYVGIVGYLTPDTKFSAVKNNVEYLDEINAIQKEVDALQNNGVNIIIALGHSGYEKDQQIAKEVEGLDLVVGGHSHTFLWNGSVPDSDESKGPYPTFVSQGSGKVVPIVQAFAYNKYLGKIHMKFDARGEMLTIDGRPILLDKSVPQDPEIIEILNRYRKDVQNVSEIVIGKSAVVLDSTICEKKECILGNLITDAIIYYYATYYSGEHWTDAPIAVLQSGGIRASIMHAQMPAFITKGELLTVLPFEGKLAVTTMNGTVLLQMLEHSVANYNAPRIREFLQYSGIRVVYNLRKPPGERVVNATVRCWACNVPEYRNIDIKQIYNVIMPVILTTGGDGYSMLNNLTKTVLPYNEYTCTEYYISKHSTIYPELEGRITMLEEDANNDSSFKSVLTLLKSKITIPDEGVSNDASLKSVLSLTIVTMLPILVWFL